MRVSREWRKVIPLHMSWANFTPSLMLIFTSTHTVYMYTCREMQEQYNSQHFDMHKCKCNVLGDKL